MDYTQSPNNVVDVSTGFRRHEDNQALPTVVSEKDINSLIWALMEVNKAAGIVAAGFDETVPATYKDVIQAIKRLAGSNITTVTNAMSPFLLTLDHDGIVFINATAGPVVLTLPAANVVANLPVEYVFYRVDATANAATVNKSAIALNADTIDGAASFVVNGQYSNRCIRSDAVSAWATLSLSTSSVVGKQIQPINASVAASALTLTLNPTQLEFRAAALTSGTVNSRILAAAASLVVPSTATLGTINAVASRLVLLALDNAGAIELAVVNLSGGNNLDETTLITTTAISAAANAANVVYSTAARVNLPFRVVGVVESTQAAAGTWVTAPSLIQGYGGQALAAMSSLGYGQTWQNVSGSRSSGTTYYNTTGKPIYIRIIITNSGVGATGVGFTVGGVNLGIETAYAPGAGQYGASSCVVPVGASYAVAFTNVTTAQWNELR